MVQWAWAYLTYQRGIRLITGRPVMTLQESRAANGESADEDELGEETLDDALEARGWQLLGKLQRRRKLKGVRGLLALRV